MRRSQKLALLAALAAGANFSGQAEAYDADRVDCNGRQFIDFAFFHEGEYKSQYTLSADLRDATKAATYYWSEMLGPRSGFSSPWPIAVITEKNVQNAYAETFSISDGKLVGENYVAQMLQGKLALDPLDFGRLVNVKNDSGLKDIMGTHAYSEIDIGQHFGANRSGAIDGWWVDTDTVLPSNEQATDFVGCFRHELGHALGIAMVKRNCDWDGNVITNEKDALHYGANNLILSKFADDVTDPNSWNYHLVDQNGNHAKAGMLIVTTEGFNLLKERNPAVQASDCFIVDVGNYAYFVGDHVTEVLAGATFNGISGVPVNAYEKNSSGAYKDFFEGSHLQTPGMMSHRPYGNYTAFMEVELAVMQDLGYDIDRKAYFGRSIYGSGLTIHNTEGFSARNAAGTAYTSAYSQVPLGIGLHVFGSHNDVTQSANIFTEGTGAVGIRVDGEGNTIHVPAATEVHGDGYRGKGILFAYGRNQNLDVAGTVTAKGTGGNAVEFNFGSSSNGALDEYRGSYIRYKRDVSEYTGDIITAKNMALGDMDINTYNASADELKGEMVTDFNLSGRLVGGENAIYIGKNAFVKNINVQKGADITGAITSDWKHFSEEQGIYATEKTVTYQDKDKETGAAETKTGTVQPLKIQYQGNAYAYTDYIPDLVTNLNFDLQDGAMLYQGNITGSDNMKMNVESGAVGRGTEALPPSGQLRDAHWHETRFRGRGSGTLLPLRRL